MGIWTSWSLPALERTDIRNGWHDGRNLVHEINKINRTSCEEELQNKVSEYLPHQQGNQYKLQQIQRPSQIKDV